MFVFRKLFSRSVSLELNDEAVDNQLILIIYKNADDDGKVKIKQLDYHWEKVTGKIWEYSKSFSKYVKGSEAYKFHKGPRAGTHEVSLSQDIITMSKVNHLIKEEQTKYRNLLFTFVKKGNLKVVKSLIEEKNIDDNIPDKNGDKPIHYAVRYEKLGILKYLCETREIDPNEKNKFGETPIFFAVKNKNVYCLQYLIDERKVDLDITDQLGIKPLFFPIKSGKLEHIEILINKENCNDFLCGDDYTALQLAAQWNQLEVVKWLIKNFKKIDVMKRNKEGKSAIDFAKNEKIKEFLLKHSKKSKKKIREVEEEGEEEEVVIPKEKEEESEEEEEEKSDEESKESEEEESEEEESEEEEPIQKKTLFEKEMEITDEEDNEKQRNNETTNFLQPISSETEGEGEKEKMVIDLENEIDMNSSDEEMHETKKKDESDEESSDVE